MKKNKWIILLVFLVAIGLAGCGNKKGTTSQNKEYLNGVYIEDKDNNPLRLVLYFKKDGTIYAVHKQPDNRAEWVPEYQDAMMGSWKQISKNNYSVNFKSSAADQHYKFNLKKDSNTLVLDLTGKSDGEARAKKSSLSASEFKSIYNQARKYDLDPDSFDGNSSNNSGSSKDSDSSSKSADPDEIGKAVYARVFPSEQVDSVEQDGDKYYVSNEYHSADSTIPFQINGDTVTYWTQADGDTTADGKNDAHTVSIKDLLGN